MKSNKAQHEIVGFAAIIIIVSIIGLIFLSLSIGRGESDKKTSVEISNFLQASMYHTINCTTSYIPDYKDIQGLIKACYKNERCTNGKMTCDVLEEDFGLIVYDSFNVSEESKNKAYKLNIYYEDSEIEINEEIMNFTEGNFNNCSSKAGANQPIFFDPGQIIIELEFCYG